MNANDLIAKVKNLAPVSHAALNLVGLLDQPAISNEDIVHVLKFDNVLTAKLLRACNSPFFGLEEPVSSVEQAVPTLPCPNPSQSCPRSCTRPIASPT